MISKVLTVIRWVLFVLCGLSGLWSGIVGPAFVSEMPDVDSLTLGLYIARAIPIGLATAAVVIVSLAGKWSAALPVVLFVSAAMQLGDLVVGIVHGKPELFLGAGAFVILQVASAIWMIRRRPS